MRLLSPRAGSRPVRHTSCGSRSGAWLASGADRGGPRRAPVVAPRMWFSAWAVVGSILLAAIWAAIRVAP